MYLSPVHRENVPGDLSTIVGTIVTANPATTRDRIVGRVIEVDGYSVVLQTRNMIVAVDIEDCDLPDLITPLLSGR